MKLIAEDLIESVKQRTMAPISQQNWTDQRILNVINEDAIPEVTAMIMSVRENFFLTYQRSAIQADKSRYVLPERAIGNALKDFWYVDSQGQRKRYVPRTDVHQLESHVRIGNGPYDFLMFGDEVMVSPTPSRSEGSLELWHYQSPSAIVKTENCAKISDSSSTSALTTFDVDTDLTGSLETGDLVDIVSSKSPFLLWAKDVEIQAISSTQIQVNLTDVQDEAGSVEPVSGDYICPAGFTNIPMFPREYHPVLAQIGAIMVLEAMGDLEKMDKAQQRLDRMLRNGFKLIANRVESAVEPIPSQGGILGSL